MCEVKEKWYSYVSSITVFVAFVESNGEKTQEYENAMKEPVMDAMKEDIGSSLALQKVYDPLDALPRLGNDPKFRGEDPTMHHLVPLEPLATHTCLLEFLS